MKRGMPLLLTLLLLFACTSCMNSTEYSAIENDVQFLCSTECFGRLPGSSGNEQAQNYIAAQFKEAGLSPLSGFESYLQPYTQAVFDSQSQSQTLTATYPDGTSKTYYSGIDFYPYLSVDGNFSGAVQYPLAIGGERFIVAIQSGRFKGKEISFVSTDMMTARITSSEDPFAFRCKKELFTALSTASSIALEGEPEIREATIHNVIGVLSGTNHTEAIIVSAHFDHVGGFGTTYYPGALDNASGVAALLQIVREMAGEQPPMDIIFVAFNGEDMGALGSAAFANVALPYEHVNAINIDLVGAAETSSLALVGDGPLSQVLIDHWSQDDSVQAIYLEEQANSDHVSLNQSGIPAVTVSSNIGFDAIAEKTHYPTDSANALDASHIASASQTIIQYLKKEESLQILSPQVELPTNDADEAMLDERYAKGVVAIEKQNPAMDEYILMKDGSDSYIVRNVTHFVSPAALKQYMPDVDLPAQLGDFILNESTPLSNVGSVMQSADGAVLGLDVYLYINEENLLPDQIYPLPEKYHRPNHSLEYKNPLGVALTLFVYADETFTVENLTTQWDRVEPISLDKGTLYVYYQQYEDGKEYPRGVLCDYPGVPGYVTLSKHDLLSEVSAEEMRNLIVNSLDALQNLPSLF